MPCGLKYLAVYTTIGLTDKCKKGILIVRQTIPKTLLPHCILTVDGFSDICLPVK